MAAPRPAVSVVMPTYGQAAFLPRAVASLRRQTLTEWELVIVDDGSLDATPQTIAGLAADQRIHHVRLATNHGLGTACNVGLDLARAPLIAYLPSDDVIDAEHLSTLAVCFDDPEVVLALVPGAGRRHRRPPTGAGDAPGRHRPLDRTRRGGER